MSGRRNIRLRDQVGDLSRSEPLSEYRPGLSQQTTARMEAGVLALAFRQDEVTLAAVDAVIERLTPAAVLRAA